MLVLGMRNSISGLKKLCWEGILGPVGCKDDDGILGRLIASCTKAVVMLEGDACVRNSANIQVFGEDGIGTTRAT